MSMEAVDALADRAPEPETCVDVRSMLPRPRTDEGSLLRHSSFPEVRCRSGAGYAYPLEQSRRPGTRTNGPPLATLGKSGEPRTFCRAELHAGIAQGLPDRVVRDPCSRGDLFNGETTGTLRREPVRTPVEGYTIHGERRCVGPPSHAAVAP